MMIDKARIEQLTGRELLRIMRQRYPYLSDDEHLDRCYAALHEAGHFCIAVLLGTFVGQNAYIAVPGRFSSWSRYRGASGSVECFSHDPLEDALVSLAGILASLKSDDPDAKVVTQQDRDEFLEALSHVDEDQRRKLKTEAIGLVDQNWPSIQNVAKAMLLLANEDGDLRGAVFLALFAYAADLAGHGNQAAIFAALVRGSQIALI
jgi:hypothetical protein